MPQDYITGKTPLIANDLVIRVVDDQTLRARDGAVVESIANGSSPANRTFWIMAICNTDTETTSVAENIDDGLSVMKYQGHEVPKALIPIHAYRSLCHRIAIR